MHKSRFFTILLFATLILQGCVSTGGGYNTAPWTDEQAQQAAQKPDAITAEAAQRSNTNLPPVKVAILLPLSGQHAQLGHSLLNASHMALMDIGFKNLEILPKDTQGTAKGSRKAAKDALRDGATIVLGPIFSDSVRAAQKVTQSANVNIVAFSTDWTLANTQTFLISFLPFDQVSRVTGYASQNGIKSIGVLSPRGVYGNGVISAYNTIAPTHNIQTTQTTRFAADGADLNTVMRNFATHQQQAVLLPAGGTVARQVGSFLNHHDMPPSTVKRLGTGLMDDPTLATDRSLDGTWFAAPSPKARTKFEQRYRAFYHEKPPRIASLAYDATALAAILARMGLEQDGQPAFDHTSITNPNGFSGVDGIFRFRNDGIVERGLAVLEYRKGRIITIDPAPRTFQHNGY